MIKLKGNEDSWLTFFVNVNGLRTKEQKYKAIETVVSNRIFSSFERNLAVVQAILDGEWEVEEPMTLNDFKSEYELMKVEYRNLRMVGNLSATRIYQEAVTKLVEEFLEEVE
ncbi:hypothetical protein PJ262_02150 [Streptococcus dysgalactiae]|uniref:hypothetical protein n=1 Tax=Streptococcus dysgalactiae TaxID=1334 RepID=UPI0012AA4E9A|nr:hypothetical protein [Streptococcus dysgalactiae]QGH03223.1 hypothetical protein EA458_01030 [Streptococcus dysgalactiae subsp. dysgalactiae]QGH03558.1 hypothetical protein EA458_02935 [Streptococcus dysgalactiae subsp. dysgalactiae]QGH04937.1 hypothetical protein EA458_11070 [Streptococcus dysgalactiae subsp. dysgalactiae]WCE85970.1 hypothetical protein PMN45_11760 [Streptococcus dysgalactiae]WCE86483.1 hypothetical protein PMN45_02550 [Streptococcus dysgalactiae]